ncbi:iron ABC transporter permease [Fodinicurvata sp. EGI_FJ10296]|uniref:FecCD family ABC transporter permease n=1 Tax=Fodinicurvata sp. EGI_FJ10296 TaxID=3231908 RepID=UPI0034527413
MPTDTSIAGHSSGRGAGRNRAALWTGLAVLTAAVAIVSLGLGRYPLGPLEVLAVLGLPVLPTMPPEPVAEAVVWQVRLPRIALAMVVGAGLSASGAALQGIFRNPLVGPQIIGVSAGAAFGGALALLATSSLVVLMSNAFIFGLIALLGVFFIARTDGRTPVLMLVLAGVVVGAFFDALVSFVTYIADPDDTLPAIVYWLMGSFASASYTKLWLVAGIVGVFGGLLHLMRFRINILSLGDEEANALGISVEPTRWAILIAVTAITAATVAVSGIVGWVGLVVPHIARMLVGPDHRDLIPASALIGAAFMTTIDSLARTMTIAEIPIGILTAIVGAPVFAILLRRTKAGGWS